MNRYLIELSDGSYLNPAYVVTLSPGATHKDHGPGWTYIQTVGGHAFWVIGDCDMLRQRVDEILARIA